MSNMSYCRFENTLNDLQDCYDAMCDDDEMKDLSKREDEKRLQLVELCRNIVEHFDDNESDIEYGEWYDEYK